MIEKVIICGFYVKSHTKHLMMHGSEQWRLDERILIQSIKSVTDCFLKELYMSFFGGNGLRKEMRNRWRD